MKCLIKNGKLILPDRIIDNGSVLIEDGIIIGVFAEENLTVDETIDAKGQYISPGFIDGHVHGGGGCDIMDGTCEAVKTVAKTHLKFGMTSFLATTLTSSKEKIQKAIGAVEQVMETNYVGAKILGIHLEGPFISMAFKGAQNPAYLIAPTLENYLDITNGSKIIKKVSMAPEREGAYLLAKELNKNGIIVSVAHSDADYAQMEKAAQYGFCHVTHMFNGMSGLKSPDYYCTAGVIEAALLLDEFTAEMICDGKHMPPEMIKLLYKCKGADKMILTTDAVSAADMPEGNYILGGLDILVTDGVAMLSDRTSFAGSVATADRLVRNAYHHVGLPLFEAVKMVSLSTARHLGIADTIGSIEEGKIADVLLFDEDIVISTILQNGKIVMENQSLL